MRSLIAAFILLSLSSQARAQEAFTDWGQIRIISAGWTLNTIAVFHTAPFVNVGCEVTEGGYATEPADPGVNLFHDIVLSAFMNKKDVQFRLEGCAFGKPRISGVNVR